ncbi:MAG: hypothetical protein IIA66_12325, partial [Planctomycetes bacterium]|nr:hypothetical protein [Planctomycetota bacterium]
MTTREGTLEENLFGDLPAGGFGSISIRAVVLPKRKKKESGGTGTKYDPPDPLDLGENEFLPEAGPTPMSSYLETSKGGRQCVVFLVNGQRQDALDNSFIIRDLGFKYLRNHMMVIVDVDGLAPEALGRLIQGSRQGFFRGDVFDAITKRVIATLKDDPDLDRLEQEAEEEVSELKAGDQKVKQTLDQLIDTHHEHGMHFAEGAGSQGSDDSEENLGIKTVTKDGVVSLLPPDRGAPADYPVLVSQPASSFVRLRPGQEREVSIKSMPSNAWSALAELHVESDTEVLELKVSQERLADHLKLKLLFQEPEGFDTDQYPIRAKLCATAIFNGISERRRLQLGVFIEPDVPPPDPELSDAPTWLSVSSREPVKIKMGGTDTHVRLRWDGKNELASGPTASWGFYARVITDGIDQPRIIFSEPSAGRLTLLVAPHPEWTPGMEMRFEVVARRNDGVALETHFNAIVVDPPEPPDPKEPREVQAGVLTGSKRRPPYVLKYINRDDYENGTCWGGTDWSGDEPGCFQEPTERAPLTLIINREMTGLREYVRYPTK